MDDESTQVAGQPTGQEDNTSKNEGLDPETLLHQKNHWKNKAVDPESGKTYKELLDEERAARTTTPQETAPAQPSQTKTNPSPASDDAWRQRIELKTDGYTSEEVDAIMELGGPQAINNPLVKEAIASIRKKAKSEAATPTDTAKSPIYQKFTEAELRAMPSAELEKILPHAD